MTHPPKALEENVPLAPYTTMKVGGPGDFLLKATDAAGVAAAAVWAKENNTEIFVLGEGSNVIIGDQGLHRLVIKMDIPGFEVVDEDKDSATVRIGAGEHWDDAVEKSVKLGLAGIEAMSMIPGTAGAAPVQNAGAYGQELADTFVELEAYDLHEQKTVTLGPADCNYGYRDSAFKHGLAGRYVILDVTLKLSKLPPAEPTYTSLRKYLDEHEITNPTVAQIRRAVMAVRSKILPDPTVVPNTGSFFKNPIVEPKVLERIRLRYPTMPAYEFHGDYKLAAGWMLDQCGFKGAEYFGLKLWAEHALVITNPNHAGYAELMQLVELIKAKVYAKFGVMLETEPLFIT